MFDFERGAKTTGSKFLFTTGEDAWREWELINYALNYYQMLGYSFIIPPYLVKKEIAEFAGILPRFKGDFYETTDDLLLIPTAETAMVGYHANEIFDEKDLPKRYVAFSPCFRREAGAYGARDKGLRRVHQFHKIELFILCKPEDSEKLHEIMQEDILKFHVNTFPNNVFRQIELIENDRSPISNKTIDIEVLYNDEWLEVSSISNMGDNQSKPAQIRYRDKEKKKNIKVHMLNGSGLALPRILLVLGDKESKFYVCV